MGLKIITVAFKNMARAKIIPDEKTTSIAKILFVA
jgi:hypothetical protein